jgi:hypothetical protein
MPSPTTADLCRRARQVLEANWVPQVGYTAPNSEVYPWLWLWDSCFHALIWGALDDQRAAVELRAVFAEQGADGFVPHMTYSLRPDAARELWGRPGRSYLTQPPMYGHAVRLLLDWGHPVEPLAARARDGLLSLVRQRRGRDGLLLVVHPWEAGTDDSPRWDAWAEEPFDRPGWGRRKRELLRTVDVSETGASLRNPAFTVAPAGFNALVAFNLRELCAVTGDGELEEAAGRIVEALERRWDEALGTWTDWSEPEVPSTRVRTLEALLPVLVTGGRDRVGRVFGQLFQDTAFGAPFGPCGVHRQEPTFRPDAYWRGAGWPQLTYLFFVAAIRSGDLEAAGRLRRLAASTAEASDFAEYFDPLTGAGLGASPQGWAGLPCVMDRLDRRVASA